jgi:hypothetical protein
VAEDWLFVQDVANPRALLLFPVMLIATTTKVRVERTPFMRIVVLDRRVPTSVKRPLNIQPGSSRPQKS